MMNDNLKIFFRKLIWASAAIYLGILVSSLGLKAVKVAYVNIKPNINLNTSLAVVFFWADDLISLYKEDNAAEVAPITADIFSSEVKYINVNNDEKNNEKEISFTFVGDIMLDRNVQNSVYKNGGGDFSFIFENVDFLSTSDITFGNLEGPVSDKGMDLGNLYSFRMNPLVLSPIKDAGFDVLSVANNHSADWGEGAFVDTLNRLELNGISPVGGGINKDDAESIKIIERNGLKVGFLAFSDVGPKWFEAGNNKPGILLAKTELVKELVLKAKYKADYVVVSFHFGNEYETVASYRQEELAKQAVDAGANIVIGHHPHVVQKIELYNGGLIAYSLGNFIFDQNFSEETMEGSLLNVVFSGQDIVSIYKKRVELNDFFQVYLSDYAD
ncbi:MAG: CapA family protein [Parcubacteria group bacterium]|nr:CapA family protein [Parcubacteria group bacterium]MCR4342379.1 CapA family protein [Patescibacteria group bacterium]